MGPWNVCRFLQGDTGISRLHSEDLRSPSLLLVLLCDVTGPLHQPVGCLQMWQITRKRSSSISSEHPPLILILHSHQVSIRPMEQPHMVRTEQHFHSSRLSQDARIANMIGSNRGVCSRQSWKDSCRLDNDRVIPHFDRLA